MLELVTKEKKITRPEVDSSSNSVVYSFFLVNFSPTKNSYDIICIEFRVLVSGVKQNRLDESTSSGSPHGVIKGNTQGS